MFEKAIITAKKAGLEAHETRFQFGCYYDGIDHDFTFPALMVTFDRNLAGNEIVNVLDEIEKLEKKEKIQVYSKGLNFGHWYFIMMKKEDIKTGKENYSECIAFQEGFWKKHHENVNASDEELIKAGHDNMIAKGFSIRSAA